METFDKPQKMHLGRKISRIREIRGIKQEAIAQELGITQQAVSKLEQSEVIEEEVLARIAKVLGVTTDAIEEFNDEAVMNFFNSFHDHSSNNGAIYAQGCTFNPLDKIIELYERLLQSERDKNDLLKGTK